MTSCPRDQELAGSTIVKNGEIAQTFSAIRQDMDVDGGIFLNVCLAFISNYHSVGSRHRTEEG
jgi:hypothetical protein